MKRISIWLFLLALTPGFAAADYFYVPPRYRVHYSPYALQYEGTGLIPGGLDYSLHAVSYDSSGLVFEGVRYTPYALSYRNSGLIYAYSPYYAYPYAGYPAYPGVATCANRNVRRRSSTASYAARKPSRTRRTTRFAAATTGTTRNEPDGVQIIRQRLRAKGFEQVDINHILSIDGTVISADFRIRDQNLLIKYWNPEQIEQLNEKSELKQRIYRDYRQDWLRFAEAQQQSGLTIYTVEESEAQTIVAALDSCPAPDFRSSPERESEDLTPPAMYARR